RGGAAATAPRRPAGETKRPAPATARTWQPPPNLVQDFRDYPFLPAAAVLTRRQIQVWAGGPRLGETNSRGASRPGFEGRSGREIPGWCRRGWAGPGRRSAPSPPPGPAR